jgi:hypothetical protein
MNQEINLDDILLVSSFTYQLRKKIHLRFRYSKLVMLAGSIEADISFDNIEP